MSDATWDKVGSTPLAPAVRIAGPGSAPLAPAVRIDGPGSAPLAPAVCIDAAVTR